MPKIDSTTAAVVTFGPLAIHLLPRVGHAVRVWARHRRCV
jgi:hypothetical protein